MTDRDRRQLLNHPTDNVRAWQLYINARYHWERKTAESFRRAWSTTKPPRSSTPALRSPPSARRTMGGARCLQRDAARRCVRARKRRR